MYYKRRDALIQVHRQDPARARLLLLQAAADPEKMLRREAAKLLGEHPGAEARAALVKALKDADSDVRRNAAQSLRKTGGPEAVEALREASQKDDSIFVRREAQEALKAIESGGAEKPMFGGSSMPPVSPAAPPPARPALSPVPAPPRPEERPRPVPAPAPAPAPDTRVRKPMFGPSSMPPVAPVATAAESPLRSAREIALDRFKPPPSGPERATLWQREREGTAAVPVVGAVPAPRAGEGRRVEVRVTEAPRREDRAAASPPELTRKVRKAVASMTEGATLCPKCRWVVKPGQRFCTFCGYALESATTRYAKAEARRPAPPPPVRAPSAVPRPPAPAVKGPGPAVGCAIAMAVAGLVLAIGIGVSAGSKRPARVQASRVPVARPARAGPASAWAAAPAPARDPAREELPAAPAEGTGRRVLLVLSSGATLPVFLLDENDLRYRVRTSSGIFNVPKDLVVEVRPEGRG
jgi:hypothetical protein